MKITKARLKQIIREEKAIVHEQMMGHITSQDTGMGVGSHEDKHQEEDRAREILTKQLRVAFAELDLPPNVFQFYARMMVNEFRG